VRTALRVVCIAFLVFGLLLGIYLLSLVLLMEGMRHGQPEPGEQAKQLFEVCFPVVFFGSLILASVFKPSPSVAKAASLFACVYAIAWLAYSFRLALEYGDYENPCWSAAVILIAVIAARWLYTTRRPRLRAAGQSA
jgi:hypothetical protein